MHCNLRPSDVAPVVFCFNCTVDTRFEFKPGVDRAIKAENDQRCTT